MAPLAGHIFMADGDQASLFAGEGVINSHPLATTVTVLWHVKWFEVLSKAKVVPKVVLRKKVATMPVGDGVSPDPGFACPFEALFDGRLTLSHLIDVVLFASKPHAPSAGACGDDAAGVPAHVQWLLLD